MMSSARIAVISGGLGDIGRACAVALAREGCDVAVCDLNEHQRAVQLRHDVEAAGRRFHFATADVASEASVDRWFDAVEQALGPIEIAIVNAAIVEQLTLREMTMENWNRHISVNLTGALCVANVAARRMAKAKRPGRIVVIGSWAAAAPHRHVPAYCVAKAGLRMLCRLLALEYAADDIQVCEVAPGVVDAGLSRQLFDQDPALKALMESRTLLGRLVEPAEVAWHVARCCAKESQNITGSTLLCDGGLSLLSAAEGGRHAAS